MSEDLLGEAESVASSLSGGTGTPDARSSASSHRIDVSKLLAQNTELRKLLADEQRRSKLADEERRRKDQELRRVEVEIDGFRFRNDQLLKRIEVLQSEMTSSNGKSGASSGKANKHSDNHHKNTDSVVEQELMKRIQENSDLRTSLENLEALTKEQTDLTAKRMSALEADLMAAEQKHLRATASLKQERDTLFQRCSTLEKQLQQSSGDKDSTIAMLEAKVASLESQLQNSRTDQGGISNTLLCEALCPPEYFRLNLTVSDSDLAASIATRQRSRSIASFSTNTDALMLALGAYGTAMLTLIQKSGISTPMLAGAVGQAKNLLQKCQQASPGVTSTNSSLISHSASTIESLSGVIRQYISASDATLQASSHGICDTLERLASQAREASSLLLANDIPVAASDWLRLAQISSSSSGLVHDHYASLVVAFVGRAEVKPALDAALQALAAASSSFETLSSLLDARARSADATASPLTSAAASLRQQFTARAVALRAACHIQSKPLSVPYERAIDLESSLAKADSERAALAERAERLAKRLKVAEEEREKWMVEAQLRQVRFEKLLQRVTGSTPTAPSPMPSSTSMGNLSRARENSMLDIATEASTNENEPGVDITWLSKHFEERISLVSSDAQRADSEAASWKAESRALVCRLVQARQLGLRITTLEKSLAERDDELETVRRSYESQLAAMAEHMASMNERIIQQADESEALQRQLRLQQQSSSSSSSTKSSKRLLGKPS